MALNIQQPNFSGVAALAGRGSGNLNLNNPGALGLQSLQQAQQAKAQQQAQNLDLMRLEQQARLARGQQDIQRQQLGQQGLLGQQQLDLRNQQLQQQQQLANRGMDIQQDQFQQQMDQKDALRKKQEAEIAQQKEMAKLIELDKKEIKERGDFASYAVTAMKSASSPEEARMLRKEILSEAVKNKYIDQDAAKQVGAAPISQSINMMMYEASKYGALDRMKTMLDANKKEKPNSSGSISITRADGTTINIDEPTKPTRNILQKDMISKEDTLARVMKMKDEFDDVYFTTKGQVTNWLSAKADRNKGIPLLGAGLDTAAEFVSGKDAEERAKQVEKTTAYVNEVEQAYMDYKHQQTGAAASAKEMADIRAIMVNSSLSPSEARGALKQMFEKVTSEIGSRKKILREGLDISEPKVFKYNPETKRFE